jgi:GxxExxY protein
MNADITPMNAERERERLDAISRKVIGAAQRVSLALGVGFLEKVYENSLVLELEEAGPEVEQQKPVHVDHAGRIVGDYIPDILVSDEIVVEIKAVPSLDAIHRAQCINHLRATGLPVCLLVNFGRPRLEVRRRVRRF